MKRYFSHITLMLLLTLAFSACNKLDVDNQTGTPQFYFQSGTDSASLFIYAGRGYTMDAYYVAGQYEKPLYMSRFVQDGNDSMGLFFTLSNNANAEAATDGSLRETLMGKNLSVGDPYKKNSTLSITYITDTARYESIPDSTSQVTLMNYSSYDIPAEKGDSTLGHTGYKVLLNISCTLHNTANPNRTIVFDRAVGMLLFDAKRRK